MLLAMSEDKQVADRLTHPEYDEARNGYVSSIDGWPDIVLAGVVVTKKPHPPTDALSDAVLTLRICTQTGVDAVQRADDELFEAIRRRAAEFFADEFGDDDTIDDLYTRRLFIRNNRVMARLALEHGATPDDLLAALGASGRLDVVVRPTAVRYLVDAIHTVFELVSVQPARRAPHPRYIAAARHGDDEPSPAPLLDDDDGLVLEADIREQVAHDAGALQHQVAERRDLAARRVGELDALYSRVSHAATPEDLANMTDELSILSNVD
jgi:hypothetical protein